MEALIAYYCAPALAGIKPANIVSCLKSRIVDIHGQLDKLNGQMNCRDIYFEVLTECENRVLVMVYRKEKLEKNLTQGEIKIFLNSFGYPQDVTLEEKISYLKKRMCNCSFPHEIGAFLGYPIHDILGFMYHKDSGCLLCGEWKVYHNADGARALFRRFNACRIALSKRVLCGQSLAQIFCAA